ncbi:hypothetical protein [Akkermansia sp.]|uniref:hypothetical protein n=1 Tax=Akkermansia sp. TaxID=1872421 RepID=UPI0011AF1759|nr:hypothetical protein [Akkermansia sp. CAG:344]
MRRFFQGKSGFRQHGPGDGRDVSAHSNGNTAFFPAVFTENWCSLHFLTSMATTANERNFKTAVTTATPNASYRIVNPEGDFFPPDMEKKPVDKVICEGGGKYGVMPRTSYWTWVL